MPIPIHLLPGQPSRGFILPLMCGAASKLEVETVVLMCLQGSHCVTMDTMWLVWGMWWSGWGSRQRSLG